MSTYIPKPSQLERRWYVLDARGQVLGKLAAKAAAVLSGKHRPQYTPFLDTGDHVVVINAAEIHLTGKKETDKIYHHPTGTLGNLKSAAVKDVRAKNPRRIVEDAIRGMLPKTKLGRAMFTKLKVYAGPSHPHQAQKPQPLAIK